MKENYVIYVIWDEYHTREKIIKLSEEEYKTIRWFIDSFYNSFCADISITKADEYMGDEIE